MLTLSSIQSIDLTKLPLPPRLGGATKDDASENVEYSSREVKPAALLLQDLTRAHSIFLLHHAPSLSALFVRSKRSRYVAMLSRYWDLFLSTWNVMLHGNPACAVFGGIKLAACGELGVGVGEEERGSGEREVLEGFVGRVEGLVDLVVSKFGEADTDKTPDGKSSWQSQDSKWIGTGEEPGAEDGAIFLGLGALSKNSLRDLTCWMEDLYTWGEDAYGVKESPTSTRAKVKRQRVKSISNKLDQPNPPTTDSGVAVVDQAKDQELPYRQSASTNGDANGEDHGSSKLMSYLKLGYGTHWSLGGQEMSTTEPEVSTIEASKERPNLEMRRSSKRDVADHVGHYLIGLKGDVEGTASESSSQEDEELESRTLLRTLTVELEKLAHDLPEEEKTQDFGSGNHELVSSRSGRKNSRNPNASFDSQDRNKTKKMRVVVYVSKPFIYVFLFENRTDSLAWESLYKSLHYQLEPLRKPLALSTSYRPGKPDAGPTASHIFDLVWDPKFLTIHSTIPSIPDPLKYMRQDSAQQDAWSRVEALSTHMQILQTFAGTREDLGEVERTCKTSRGWWVVWTRIVETKEVTFAIPEGTAPPSLPMDSSQDSEFSDSTVDSSNSIAASASPPATLDDNAADSGVTAHDSGATAKQKESKKRKEKRPKVSKEIFLIRRAGESGARSRSLSQISEGKEGWADGASRLAHGIGVDTKKYVEGLLSLAQ